MYSGIRALLRKLEAQHVKTHEDDTDSKNSERSRTPKFPHIEDFVDLVQERLNQASQQFPKGMEYSRLRPSNSPL